MRRDNKVRLDFYFFQFGVCNVQCAQSQLTATSARKMKIIVLNLILLFHFASCVRKKINSMKLFVSLTWWSVLDGVRCVRKMKRKKVNAKVENVMKIVDANFYNFLDELFG